MGGPLPAPGDVLWLDEDQDKVLAYLEWAEAQEAERAQACRRCGTKDSDWLDEEGRLRIDPPWRWAVHECPGCRTSQAALEEVPENDRRFARAVLKPAEPPEFEGDEDDEDE